MTTEQKRMALANAYSSMWANDLSDGQVHAIYNSYVERLRSGKVKETESHSDCAAGGGYHQMTIWEFLK